MIPWYLHLYHLAWLVFFLALGYYVSWVLTGMMFSAMAVTFFMYR
jgi:hypothetical protein